MHDVSMLKICSFCVIDKTYRAVTICFKIHSYVKVLGFVVKELDSSWHASYWNFLEKSLQSQEHNALKRDKNDPHKKKKMKIAATSTFSF